MSEIVGVLKPSARWGEHPTLLVRCASCRETYVTTCGKSQALKQRRCARCRYVLPVRRDRLPWVSIHYKANDPRWL